jgi:hypothetical protein
MAARGANVCRVHGGSAPQVKAAAQRRLQNAADALTARLLGFALDQGVPDAIALQAVRDALDRAGLSPKHAVDVEVSLKPYESILEGLGRIQSGSRAEHRRAIGRAQNESQPALAESPALPCADSDAPIDAEIVTDGDELIAAMRSSVHVERAAWPTPLDYAEHVAADGTATGMMTLEEAVAAQAEARRQTTANRRSSSAFGTSQ